MKIGKRIYAVKGRLASSVAVAALAGMLVGDFEGLRTTAYRDVVGIPTVCFGETRGVKMGDVYSADECAVMLGDRLKEFEAEMVACIDAPAKVPDRSYVAFLSLAYNIGSRAFCKSTLVKRLNSGNLRAACDQLLRWNRAGGRVIRGLTVRREAERKLCLEGLAGKAV